MCQWRWLIEIGFAKLDARSEGSERQVTRERERQLLIGRIRALERIV